MSAPDQFFDKGWCWMAHPSRNNGNPIPVFMYEANGQRFYVPLDPSEGGEFAWDDRDDEWQMVQEPMADLKRAVAFEDRISKLRDRLVHIHAACIDGRPNQAVSEMIAALLNETER